MLLLVTDMMEVLDEYNYSYVSTSRLLYSDGDRRISMSLSFFPTVSLYRNFKSREIELPCSGF